METKEDQSHLAHPRAIPLPWDASHRPTPIHVPDAALQRGRDGDGKLRQSYLNGIAWMNN